MSLSPQSLETKPYNVCIDCIHIGKNCDGPNFLAMSTERWCEWCHLRKEYLDLTNAVIADAAEVSKISVDRIMSGHVKDLRVTTMQAVTKALVNGTWGQYPCAMASVSKEFVDNPALIEQCKKLQTTLDAINAEHKAELAELRKYEEGRVDYLKDQVRFKEEQMRKKDKLLEERFELIKRRNRLIYILALLLGLTAIAIISLLAIDLFNTNIGFFGR